MRKHNWTPEQLKERRADLYEMLDDPNVENWKDKVREIEEITSELLLLGDDDSNIIF